jgi:sugar phosphate isomerase/epimerase
MKLAVEVGSVADGTLAGAIQYNKDLEVERLVVPFARVPGYQETGALDLAAMRDVKAQVEAAGQSFSVMVHWARSPLVTGIATGTQEGNEAFAGLCRSLEVMGQVGADILSIFASIEPPLDPAEEGARWNVLIDFYRKLMPQAENNGVKVAVHTVAMPARNMLWTYAAVERLMADVPSDNNGVTFCVGNFWNSDGERLYDIIRRLGDKIFYVHTRSTKVSLGETPFWFDSGGPDFPRVFRALRDIGFAGDVRSEHMPEVSGENRTDVGTAWSIGYSKAVLQMLK